MLMITKGVIEIETLASNEIDFLSKQACAADRWVKVGTAGLAAG
jgi:hypothetical protein